MSPLLPDTNIILKLFRELRSLPRVKIDLLNIKP